MRGLQRKKPFLICDLFLFSFIFQEILANLLVFFVLILTKKK